MIHIMVDNKHKIHIMEDSKVVIDNQVVMVHHHNSTKIQIIHLYQIKEVVMVDMDKLNLHHLNKIHIMVVVVIKDNKVEVIKVVVIKDKVVINKEVINKVVVIKDKDLLNIIINNVHHNIIIKVDKHVVCLYYNIQCAKFRMLYDIYLYI